MFTGIVEYLGTAVSVIAHERGRTMAVDAGRLADGASIGDSIAVNGVCLTVVASDGPLTFEVVGETVDRTNLGWVEQGDPLNLERPLAADGRFDGHIVQGHVDGVGVVESVTADGAGSRMTIALPTDLSRYVVEKGSITVDGVSLTVASVDDSMAEIALIPHTLDVTTLGNRSAGARVNLEVDVLAKYVERLMKVAG